MSDSTYDGPIRVGQVRPSQLMHSFGIGGLIDLPHISVIVNGLDDWDERRSSELHEDRLLALIRQRPGLQAVARLRRPPWEPETGNPFDEWARVGVAVSLFPRWLRCPWGGCQYLGPLDDGQFERYSNLYRPDRTAYLHKNCKKKGKGATAVPVRFLLTCEAGHLDEFPWVDYVHRRTPCDAPLLSMTERGQSSGPADVFVNCRSCGVRRTMREAFGETAEVTLPKCRGRHPHLSRYDQKPCKAGVRALMLGASNSWFASQLSVLSIPGGLDPLPALVDELWPALEEITERAIFDFAIRRDESLSRLQNYTDDEVWQAIEAHRNSDDPSQGNAVDQLDVHGPEWKKFTSVGEVADADDFRIRDEEPPAGFEDTIVGVVKAERLREVVAFAGFTRLTSPDELGESRIAPIKREPPTWVPAVEVRGEGIFLQLDEAAVRQWEQQYRATATHERLLTAHRNWRARRGMDDTNGGWRGARYILLHTLSHLLMRELALDCGYAASSIRERLYSSTSGEGMAGILLYTAAPDSEGTLGGLVSLGTPDRLGRLLRQALQSATICTSDPTCAEHVAGKLGDDQLHGAACHCCLFASETSCERGNRYLDRAAVIATDASTSGDSVGFFDSYRATLQSAIPS